MLLFQYVAFLLHIENLVKKFHAPVQEPYYIAYLVYYK